MLHSHSLWGLLQLQFNIETDLWKGRMRCDPEKSEFEVTVYR
jgi:hypothetical protein